MKCPRCQALNMDGDRKCMACKTPLRQTRSSPWKGVAFVLGAFLGVIAAGFTFAALRDGGHGGRVLTVEERENKIGQLIGRVLGVGTAIATVVWLRSRRAS